MSRIAAPLWRFLGTTLESRGITPVAEYCFRQAAESLPLDDVRDRVRLARGFIRARRYADAADVLEPAAECNPKDAEYWNLLGIARREANEFEGAKQAFENSLAVDPNYLSAWINIGNWLLARGRAEEGLQWFDRVLAREPDQHEAQVNRVSALLDLGRPVEALEAATSALALHPDSAALHLNLGAAHLQSGNGYHRAMQSFRRALEIQPEFEEVHFNLSLMGLADHLGGAVSYLRRQLALRGDSVDLMNRLAIACTANNAFLEARELSKRILEIQPNFSPAHISLGNTVSTMGMPAEALACFESGLQVSPSAYAHSNALFEVNYLDSFTPQEVFQRHRDWAEHYEVPFRGDAPLPTPKRGPRLTIGYVSPDFRKHPVGFLVAGILPKHDRTHFEVHCYSHVVHTDWITEELESSVEHWHDTIGMSDDEVAEQIRRDGIDILVDLTGHTANHRLRTFARKPAPVQATWIGYFHSTGMESIDYFITDPYSTPPGCSQLFSETPIRLPHTRFCYTPPEYAPPVSVVPPCESNGFVTFGSFNKLAKLSDSTVRTWARVLGRVPDSRLRLKSPALIEEEVRQYIAGRFEAHGIDAARLELRPASGHRAMLEEYAEVDIALDPFPFTGGMTSFEALYMGVPVVTLAGESVVGRQTTSMLSNIGMEELVADTMDAYVELAAGLASERSRLADLRKTLRTRLEASPLMDADRFIVDLENLYRDMWGRYIAQADQAPAGDLGQASHAA